MAERRMFAKTIIDSDAFIDMPVTARLLYYDLGMRADDDGFVNSPKKIMRMIGASEDDMRILIQRKFIIPFDNGVVVIKHWRIHNYIRNDTYKPTPYHDEKAQLEFDENKAYRLVNGGNSTDSRRFVDDPSTQDRLGKDSIGKDNNTPLSPSSTSGKFTRQEMNSMVEERCFPLKVEEAVMDWISYKIEKRQGYKKTGFKNLLTQIGNKLSEYSPEVVEQVIRESMSSNYQGIIWDYAKKLTSGATTSAYIDTIKNRVNIVDTWAADLEEYYDGNNG